MQYALRVVHFSAFHYSWCVKWELGGGREFVCVCVCGRGGGGG